MALYGKIIFALLLLLLEYKVTLLEANHIQQKNAVIKTVLCLIRFG